MTAVNLAAWQAHAQQRLAQDVPGPLTPPTRLELTQHPGHGPGPEIIGALLGCCVVELGCGPGHNLAHLVAHHGAVGVGVHAVPDQVKRARAHYGHLPGIDFIAADAATYLTTVLATSASSRRDMGRLDPDGETRLSRAPAQPVVRPIRLAVSHDHPPSPETSHVLVNRTSRMLDAPPKDASSEDWLRRHRGAAAGP